MKNTIYLHEEHQNFQHGKTKLAEEILINFDIIYIILFLTLGLLALWFCGISLKNEIPQTLGTINLCEPLSVTTYYIEYQYTVDGKLYRATERRLSEENSCDDFPIGFNIIVQYLPDNPQDSIVASDTSSQTFFLLFFGIVFVGISYFLIVCIQNFSDKRGQKNNGDKFPIFTLN